VAREFEATVEWRDPAALIPYEKNAKVHSAEQIAKVAASIAEFGFDQPIVVDGQGVIIKGHARREASLQLGLPRVPVVVRTDLSPTQVKAARLADNKIAESPWDEALLREELQQLEDQDFALDLVGFSDEDLRGLLADGSVSVPAEAVVVGEEEVPEAPVEPVTRTGDIWQIGRHRLICGDCRDYGVVERLFAGARANVVITSPPYATQREYDPASGFEPIRPDEYVDWFRDVAANVATILASDGSYFLNIKEHAEGGQRSLYVKDLVIAHVRQWGWWFIDEFCWRKTDNGVPGGWGNRFKNAWEPVFHLGKPEARIKFRPEAVGHVSEDCFDYSPNNPKSTSGSGLLGTGARGTAAGQAGSDDDDGRFTGIARPSNVIEVKSESSQGSHSAPFPRALVEFFVKAFSDQGDIIFDPFLGSGTSMAAAAMLNRIGYGCELSPAYCDVILRRMTHLTGDSPSLAATGEPFAAVVAARGVSLDQAPHPKQQDSRAIKHHGPNPHYGPRRKRGEVVSA